MEYRYLGHSGFKISEITYGNWLTHGSQVENEQARSCVYAQPWRPASAPSTRPTSTPTPGPRRSSEKPSRVSGANRWRSGSPRPATARRSPAHRRQTCRRARRSADLWRRLTDPRACGPPWRRSAWTVRRVSRSAARSARTRMRSQQHALRPQRSDRQVPGLHAPAAPARRPVRGPAVRSHRHRSLLGGMDR